MALSKKKKVLIGVVCVLVVAGGLKVAFGGGGDMGVMVNAGAVEQGDMEETLKLKAVLEGTESVEIVSRLHYQVTDLLVNEGDKVTTGQLLAKLDGTDLSQQISLASGSVSLIQLQNQETLEARQRTYEITKKEYDDTKALFDIGAASQDELDKAKKALDAIPSADGKATLSAAEKQTLSNTVQQRNNQAQSLEDCEIRSTIDGTVTRVYTKIGRFADEPEENKPMFVIENIDKLQMKVLVNEKDIGKIEVGQEAEISANILGNETIKGLVTRISPTGEAKDGGTERVIPVIIELQETNEKLIAGITAKATIFIAKAENTLMVPFEAVSQNDNDETFIYSVTPEGTIHIIPVTCGLETDVMTEVKSDEISVGTQVVLNPELSLTEGMPVTAIGGMTAPDEGDGGEGINIQVE